MYDSGLTIFIPTYNREARLKEQLNSIFRQNNISKVKIIIADNNSNYDIKQSLETEYSLEILNNVEIIKRPINVGLGLAITIPFLVCKTEWLWILGDDDEVVGDINVLIKDLIHYKDYAYLKYNIANSGKHEDIDINGIDDFIEYYTSKKHSTGDLVFISNCIFNLTHLNQYLGLALMWSGTLIGHLIPVFWGLCENSIKCRMIDYDLVRYKPPTQGTGYDSIWVTLGISLIGDIEFPVSQKLNSKIYQLVQYDCSHMQLINDLMLIENTKRRKYIYSRIYNSCYNLGLKNKLYRSLFYISCFFHINLAKYILVTLNKTFNFIYSHFPKLKVFIKRKFPNSYRRFKFW
jgi:glycosyltransferase involved in cell wall biosynthesis